MILYDVNHHRAPQCVGMLPFSNLSELLAISCSPKIMMISQTVQELSRWQTNTRPQTVTTVNNTTFATLSLAGGNEPSFAETTSN